jgi:pyruvate/2-oxoglutarate dehydrogenase complex dihydrolipoamide acyltransferase (E2) component
MSGERLEIRVEDPGDVEEVEVVEVKVAVGDSVAKGDVLLEIATDKANMDIEAPEDGVVEELPVAEGDIISPKVVLAVLRT